MVKLTLEIKFGNAAMQTNMDAAMALQKVADQLQATDFDLEENEDEFEGIERVILDLNGNRVGKWEIG